MIDTLYSIGYSGFQADDFIGVLERREISLVVDVRSNPYSKYFPEYNKENLESRLKKIRIHYRNYSKEFGAKQEERKYYSKSGFLNFELFSKSIEFLSGVKKLIGSMSMGYTFALMCAEKEPIKCHRTILVSKAFFDAGYKVIHLLPDNTVLTQEDIESRLVELYFPNREQLSMFDQSLSSSEYIREAYQKQNANIGYSIEEEIS